MFLEHISLQDDRPIDMTTLYKYQLLREHDCLTILKSLTFDSKFSPINVTSKYRESPTSTVLTCKISTSTIFIAIGIKPVLVEFSRIFYVVKFVLVEIAIYRVRHMYLDDF